MMSLYKLINKKIAFHLSKFIPIQIKNGLSSGIRLYGNLFYNRRSKKLYDEEIFYKKLNLKDKVIIEAGAYIGIYTMFFATKINHGKILAFEPNPVNFYFLNKNLQVNSCKSVITHNAGLSNKKGELHFVSKRYNRAKGSFKTDKQQIMKADNVPLISKKISVTTIDGVVEKYSLKSLDFVKIDTEGFEPYVIEGMSESLKSYKPIIYFEIHGLTPQQKHDDLVRVIKTLNRYDFAITKLTKGLPEVSENMDKENSGGGYVAYHDKLVLNLEKALNHWSL